MTGGQAGSSERVARNARLVLCLDGSTGVSSTALLGPGPERVRGSLSPFPWEVLERRAVADTLGHARVLLRLTDEMLGARGLLPRDLGAVVVGIGPGTFTGVRVAVAMARSLALALAIPVVGVSTLSALAAEVAQRLERGDLAGQPERLVVAVDARRNQLFYVCYERVGGLWRRTTEIAVCARQALGEVAAAPALVAAEDRDLVGELPQGVTFVPVSVAAEHLVLGQEWLEEPSQGVVGSGTGPEEERPWGSRLSPWLVRVLGQGEPAVGRPGETGTPEAVKPIYIRPPDADVHITKMRDPWAAGEQSRFTGKRIP